MTVTCGVCGATVEPALDCPVCGAVLPEPAVEDRGDRPADDTVADAPDPTPRPPTHLPPPVAPSLPPVVPPPTMGSSVPGDMRSYAMWLHLSAYVSAFFLVAFVLPLVLWLVRRDAHPFVDHHGREAVNFNLSLLLYAVLGFVVAVFTIGFGLLVVIPAAVVLFGTWVIAPIVAAVKANRGEGFRYPVTIRFISDP